MTYYTYQQVPVVPFVAQVPVQQIPYCQQNLGYTVPNPTYALPYQVIQPVYQQAPATIGGYPCSNPTYPIAPSYIAGFKWMPKC
ncbi:Hypothetical protein EIN_416730, partial [Entamoeba invadens IP1]